MVYRWGCHRCEYVVWSSKHDEMTRAVKSHLLDHYQANLSEHPVRLERMCPMCGENTLVDEEGTGVEEFEDHLFAHVESRIRSDAHVADDIDRSGSVLVLPSAGGSGADNARIHFLAPCDVVVFVTRDPVGRIRLLGDERRRWPEKTVVLTPEANPLDGLPEEKVSALSPEVVDVGDRSLGALGRTISHTLRDQAPIGGRISVAFDMLPEILDRNELKRVFYFLDVLNARIEEGNALAHYYLDPREQARASVNILHKLFDLTMRAENRVFVSEPRGSG